MYLLFFSYEKSTQKKINWAMKAYVRWMNCRNYMVQHGILSANRVVLTPEELIKLSVKEMVKVLCLFVMEVKNGNGQDYNSDTLYDLIVMVQSYLKQGGRVVKFFEDPNFFTVKNTLDNRMKDLSKIGKIAPREKAQPISVNEEDIMWEKGILGDESPEKLVDTMLYLIGVHFALRAAEEHKSLKIDCQFKVLYDEEVGLKYLDYKECTSKCNQGGLNSRFVRGKDGRAYQNVVNTDRCVVRLYEKYMSHRPDHMPKCSKDFYLRPLTVPNGDVWYSCQPRGRHKLEKVVKEMCKKAGFSGKKTNHSLRASSATRMYAEGLDEQLICERTGHRSVAVRSYKRMSNAMLRDVSDVLYGQEPKKLKVEGGDVKVKPSATLSKPPADAICNDNEAKRSCGDGEVTKEIKVENQSNESSHKLQLPNGIVLNINLNVSK